jgi:transcriptional regulator with XRE-family HTH domain
MRGPSADRCRCLPEDFHDDPRVLSAREDGDLVRILAVLRAHQPERTQAEMARLCGLSQSTIHRIENLGRQPSSPDTAHRALAHLGLVPALQLDLDPQPFAPDQGWDRDHTMQALAGVLDAPLSRRAFAAAATSTLAAHVFEWARTDSAEAVATARGRPVSPHLLAALRSSVDTLRVADARSGASTELRALARPQLAFLHQLLDRGHHDPELRRELLALTADLTGLMGWMMVDSGDQHRAAHLLQVGLRTAHAAEDPVLGAGIVSYMAVLSYSTGHGTDAALMSHTAQMRVGGHSTPYLESMLSIRQARGHAAAASERAARRSLEAAFAAFEHGPCDQDPSWLYWISRGELHGQAGSCLLQLGDHAGALEHLDQAIEGFGADCVRDQASAHTRAATALVHLGEVEQASQRAHVALGLAEQIRSRRLLDQVHDLMLTLEPHERHPDVRELADRARLLSSVG